MLRECESARLVVGVNIRIPLGPSPNCSCTLPTSYPNPTPVLVKNVQGEATILQCEKVF